MLNIEVQCLLKQEIAEKQKVDKGLSFLKERMKRTRIPHFNLDEQGVLWFDNRLVVPKDKELRDKILRESHDSKLSIHLGSSKMHRDLRPYFWWTKMKKEIAAYVARCDTCYRVKAIHLKQAGLLQPLEVPKWK